jgi:predicted transcriptional regulator
MPINCHILPSYSTLERIEQALANGPLTAKELAEQLELSVDTIRHWLPITNAVSVGSKRIGVGRPWIRYALHGWKPSPGESETVGFNHVKSVEQAIALTPMTVLALRRNLSLSESTIRSALLQIGAVVIKQHLEPRQRGRKPAVYGLPLNTCGNVAAHARSGPHCKQALPQRDQRLSL